MNPSDFAPDGACPMPAFMKLKPREFNVVAIVKHEQKFVFFFDDDPRSRLALVRHVLGMAGSDDFTETDADVVMRQADLILDLPEPSDPPTFG